MLDDEARIEMYALGRFRVVAVGGELDLLTSLRLRHQLFAEIDSRPPGVIVDLTEVRHADSAGLCPLLDANQRARLVGVQFAVAGLANALAEVLTTIGADRFFTVYGSLDAAVDGLHRGSGDPEHPSPSA